MTNSYSVFLAENGSSLIDMAKVFEKAYGINFKNIDTNYLVAFIDEYKCVLDLSNSRIKAIFTDSVTQEDVNGFGERLNYILDSDLEYNGCLIKKDFEFESLEEFRI